MDYRCTTCRTRLRVTSGSSALAPDDRCPVCAASLEGAPVIFEKVHRLVALKVPAVSTVDDEARFEAPAPLAGQRAFEEQGTFEEPPPKDAPSEELSQEELSAQEPYPPESSLPESASLDSSSVQEQGAFDGSLSAVDEFPGSATEVSPEAARLPEPLPEPPPEMEIPGDETASDAQRAEDDSFASSREEAFEADLDAMEREIAGPEGITGFDPAPQGGSAEPHAPEEPAGRRRLLGLILGALAGGVGAGGLVVAPVFLGSEVPLLGPLAAGLVATGAMAGFLFAPRRRA